MAETTAAKQPGKRFVKGQSGNPAGRPKGARHKATMAAEAILDGEAEALTRIAVEKAMGGDSVALRLCLERILPARRDRYVAFALPPLETAADLGKAAGALVRAVATGELTPGEAGDLSKLLDSFGRVLEVTEIEDRIKRLEERTAQ